MAKIRVGQLAKELNLKVSDVMARLRELGAEVKSNLSTVEDELAARLRSAPEAKGSASAAVPEAAAKNTDKVTPRKQATAHGGPMPPTAPPKAVATPPRATSPIQTLRGPVVKTPVAAAK